MPIKPLIDCSSKLILNLLYQLQCERNGFTVFHTQSCVPKLPLVNRTKQSLLTSKVYFAKSWLFRRERKVNMGYSLFSALLQTQVVIWTRKTKTVRVSRKSLKMMNKRYNSVKMLVWTQEKLTKFLRGTPAANLWQGSGFIQKQLN